jgi:hypothetical protein
MSVSSGFQLVRVPVLSKNITSTFEVFSKVAAFFISIHDFAHLQVHTIIAAGVASHKAQGQAITKVATAGTIEVSILHVI